jgi:hypothetical protein
MTITVHFRPDETIGQALIRAKLIGQKRVREQEEAIWHGKIMELVKRHSLGFLHNPGGGQFLNRKTDIDIQVSNWDTKDDYETLLAGLRNLNLEPPDLTDMTVEKLLRLLEMNQP